MFTALKTVSKSELAKLKAANSKYAALLSTSHGRAFETNVGNADIIKLYAALASPQAASGASGDGGASGAAPVNPTPVPTPGTGVSCVAPGVNGNVLPLSAKIEALNCLVFDTPHSPFWVTQATKTNTGNDLATAGDRYDFLGYGDWTCSGAPDNPFLPSCLKHDVSYSSLKKFVANFYLLDEGLDFNKDAAWHPRNKLLADVKLYLDLLKDATSLQSVAGPCEDMLPSGWTGGIRNTREVEAVLAYSACSMFDPPATITLRAQALPRAHLMTLIVNLAGPPGWTPNLSNVIDVLRNPRFEKN